jgi:hypothetical protein
MKAILQNKEDDLHFLLKCLVEELEDTLLKKEDESEEKKPLDEFEEADKKAKKAKEADKEIVDKETKRYAAYLGEQTTKDGKFKLTTADIESYNKMYNGFQNWVIGRQSARRTLDTLNGTKKTKGKIKILEEQLKELKEKGKRISRKRAKTGKKISDVIAPPTEQFRTATDKEIKDAEKTLTTLKDMRDKAQKKIDESNKDTKNKEINEKIAAGKDFVFTHKIGNEEIKLTLKNKDVKRAIYQREQALQSTVPIKVSYEEALGVTDKPQLDKLKNLLDDKDIKRALGEMVEIQQEYPNYYFFDQETDKGKVSPRDFKEQLKEKGKEAITQAFIEDSKTQETKTKGSKKLEMYLRVVGLIEAEMKKLRRQGKPTTQKKTKKLLEDLQILRDTFNAKKILAGGETDEDPMYRPKSPTNTYYKNLEEAIRNFKDSLKSDKSPEEISINARVIFNKKQLKNFDTVMSVLNIIGNREIEVDKLQKLLERETKLREFIKNNPQESFDPKTKLTSNQRRKKNEKDKQFRNANKELEKTVKNINELKQKEKQGYIPKLSEVGGLKTLESDAPIAPSSRSPMSLRQQRAEKVTTERRQKYIKFKQKLEQANKTEKRKLVEENPLFAQRYLRNNPKNKEIKNLLQDLKKSYNIIKQNFEAYRRYDIDKNKNIEVRTMPFDETAEYADTIKENIEKIRKLLKETMGNKTIEQHMLDSFEYNKEDITTEGKTKRKKLREFVASQKKKIQNRRKKDEQVLQVLGRNIINQLTDLEEEMEDSLFDVITNIFPDSFIKTRIPHVSFVVGEKLITETKGEGTPNVRRSPKDMRQRHKEFVARHKKKFSDFGKKITFEMKINSGEIKFGPLTEEQTKQKQADEIKGKMREYLAILPHIKINGEGKPTGEAIEAIQTMNTNLYRSLAEIHNIDTFEITEEEIKQKQEETINRSKEIMDRQQKTFEQYFKVYKGEIDEMFDVFIAIEKFVESYRKQRKEYLKVVEQIQSLRPQKYKGKEWLKILEELGETSPPPREQTSVPTAKRD